MSDTRRPWSASHAWEDAYRPIGAAPEGSRGVLHQFAEWLRFDRCLQPGTVTIRLTSGREFLRTIAGGADSQACIRALTPSSVESYFVGYAATAGYASRRNMACALRLFLQFSGDRRWVDPALREAVPTLRTYRLDRVVRGIEDQQIRRLLDAVSGSSPGEIRDRAILLILATYGVRRCQICALRLDDIQWGTRRILFREQKGGKPVEHELSAPAAQALARYLREVRPRIDHPEVFLRLERPILPLGRAAVSQAVRRRFEQAGIKSTSKGTHLFRHAFATRQLREGRSLKIIADLLGHRSLTSTTIYTKVDQPALREVAVEWPEAMR